MKPEIKEKWLAALRSGQYEQGTNQLRDGDAFCCLGVLCDLYAKENKDGVWDMENEEFVILDSDGEWRLAQCHSVLPMKVRDWAGLKCVDPTVLDETLHDLSPSFDDILPLSANSLAELNDGGASFKTIAAIIECDPEL